MAWVSVLREGPSPRGAPSVSPFPVSFSWETARIKVLRDRRRLRRSETRSPTSSAFVCLLRLFSSSRSSGKTHRKHAVENNRMPPRMHPGCADPLLKKNKGKCSQKWLNKLLAIYMYFTTHDKFSNMLRAFELVNLVPKFSMYLYRGYWYLTSSTYSKVQLY
jgi:hypothetical protein